jgi:predicted nucleotidyltransferase
MPAKRIIKLIKELNSRIYEQYKDFKGCYLYGSIAKGTAHKDSDIDLVAIFDYIDWNKDFELGGIICELMYKYDVYIDLHSYTKDSLSKNPIYYNEVVNKGVFYEAT